jgi:hypothetical protein
MVGSLTLWRINQSAGCSCNSLLKTDLTISLLVFNAESDKEHKHKIEHWKGSNNIILNK